MQGILRFWTAHTAILTFLHNIWTVLIILLGISSYTLSHGILTVSHGGFTNSCTIFCTIPPPPWPSNLKSSIRPGPRDASKSPRDAGKPGMKGSVSNHGGQQSRGWQGGETIYDRDDQPPPLPKLCFNSIYFLYFAKFVNKKIKYAKYHDTIFDKRVTYLILTKNVFFLGAVTCASHCFPIFDVFIDWRLSFYVCKIL